MSYREFLKHCNPTSDDPVEVGGYESVEARDIRLNTIVENLTQEKLEPGLNLADIGCGTGHFAIRLKELFNFKSVVLYDLKQYFSQEMMRKAYGSDYIFIQGNYIDADGPIVDVSISTGAFNYIPISEQYTFIKNMFKMTRKLIVLETNIQSPQTSWRTGVYNPSLDSIYNIFYELYLQYGGLRKVEVSLIKKYTAIFTVSYGE